MTTQYEKTIKQLKAARQPIIDKCIGCSRVDGHFCNTFVIPEKRWPVGKASFSSKCMLADHIQSDNKNKGTFVNPIKQSKRMYK